ncbi:hypothetical protein B2J88_48845 [Rhodococcus sp. SRB_17]|uniref:hypothetical protein n=1 Tax=Acidovorax sp. SRB_24 TaxID=1962700 RepID=UPI00145C9AFC|nr:hypothetical protein [Acidovorax sp. SRB_24]NMM78843.1 hypothetical protein [Acidovorax sp. SRB_24]NMM92081.1 hypothetical protein [Rhodococcus sp. SRB_17]
MRVEICYRWRIQSPAGRWFTTRHSASEEAIRKEHPEAMPVEGSRTERIILDQPAELVCAGFHSPHATPSVLIWPCSIPGREGRIPLGGQVSDYTVTQDGENWVVMLHGTTLMYRGAGPVRVEAAP